MIDVAERNDAYLEAFDERERRADGGPPWLAAIRRAAMLRFSEVGFPTTRQEAWRYTNVAPIASTSFRLAGRDEALRAAARLGPSLAERLAELSFDDGRSMRAVFVNGHLVESLSRLAGLPQGVEVLGLAGALQMRPAFLEPHLAGRTDTTDHPFASLNTAFLGDGAFVLVPKGVVLEDTVHLVFVTLPDEGPAGETPARPPMAHPRVTIVAEESARASIAQSHVGWGQGASLTNAVTDILAGDGSVVEHCALQREGPAAFHVSCLRATLGRSSSLRSHAVSLGGRLARSDISIVMDGEGADCTLNGLYVTAGSQHCDSHTVIDHARPHGTSRQLYKGVLDGRSRGIFDGTVIVRPGAQKTDSRQENRNLILSEEALADSKPTLRIEANDVKCSHAATTGQLDEQSLFYLRSRAIDPQAARRIMIHAFVSDVIRRIQAPSLRAGLDALLFGLGEERTTGIGAAP